MVASSFVDCYNLEPTNRVELYGNYRVMGVCVHLIGQTSGETVGQCIPVGGYSCHCFVAVAYAQACHAKVQRSCSDSDSEFSDAVQPHL